MEEKKIKFRSHFVVEDYKIPEVDCSNKFDDSFIMVEPFAVNEETGEILNKTKVVQHIKGEPINVYDRIQSYADECDIYKLLQKMIQSGTDLSSLPVNGVYDDLTGLPTDPIDIKNYIDSKMAELSKQPTDVQNIVLSEDVQKAFDEYVKLRLNELQAAQEVKQDDAK